jgi:hypothetical protein
MSQPEVYDALYDALSAVELDIDQETLGEALQAIGATIIAESMRANQRAPHLQLAA